MIDLEALLDMVTHEPLTTPVVLTPDEYESLKRRASAMTGGRCETLTTLAGHQIRVFTALPRVIPEIPGGGVG